jgi:hypothetical protein
LSASGRDGRDGAAEDEEEDIDVEGPTTGFDGAAGEGEEVVKELPIESHVESAILFFLLLVYPVTILSQGLTSWRSTGSLPRLRR